MGKVNRGVMQVAVVIAERDGIPLSEAVEVVEEAVEAAMTSINRGADPEEEWMQITGLEPDYLMEAVFHRL